MAFLEQIHQMVWGPWTMVAFLGVGLFFSLKSRLFQLRGFSYWWKATVGSLGKKDGNEEQGKGGKKGISQFQSVCTALAATVGTGNIAGVATALTAGGPGALFWMWVSALIGMITAYAETTLGIRYRYRDENGRYMCGPYVYMERGLGMKGMGIMYGVLCLLASMGMGSMVQSNSAVGTMAYSWHIPELAGGLMLTALIWLVISGGISRIGTVAEKLMPAASGIYIVFSLVVILSCAERLPQVFGAILSGAFTPSAAAGGAAGYGISRSLRYGMARGVFSNEAGLGTLAVLHGEAKDTTPQQQGMWAMFEVFFDTILICTMTALVILCMTGGDAAGSGYEGAALTAYCFSKRLGGVGEYLVSAAMMLFAFATIIAWYYLGRQASAYLAERLKEHNRCLLLSRILRGRAYTFLYLGAVFLGCVARLETVWELSDIWNGLMALPNIAALIFLMKEVTFPRGKGEEIRTEKT